MEMSFEHIEFEAVTVAAHGSAGTTGFDGESLIQPEPEGSLQQDHDTGTGTGTVIDPEDHDDNLNSDDAMVLSDENQSAQESLPQQQPCLPAPQAEQEVKPPVSQAVPSNTVSGKAGKSTGGATKKAAGPKKKALAEGEGKAKRKTKNALASTSTAKAVKNAANADATKSSKRKQQSAAKSKSTAHSRVNNETGGNSGDDSDSVNSIDSAAADGADLSTMMLVSAEADISTFSNDAISRHRDNTRAWLPLPAEHSLEALQARAAFPDLIMETTMKKLLPPMFGVEPAALSYMREALSDFLGVIMSEAINGAKMDEVYLGRRVTPNLSICGEDVVEAMESLGMHDYANASTQYLTKINNSAYGNEGKAYRKKSTQPQSSQQQSQLKQQLKQQHQSKPQHIQQRIPQQIQQHKVLPQAVSAATHTTSSSPQQWTPADRARVIASIKQPMPALYALATNKHLPSHSSNNLNPRFPIAATLIASTQQNALITNNSQGEPIAVGAETENSHFDEVRNNLSGSTTVATDLQQVKEMEVPSPSSSSTSSSTSTSTSSTSSPSSSSSSSSSPASPSTHGGMESDLPNTEPIQNLSMTP